MDKLFENLEIEPESLKSNQEALEIFRGIIKKFIYTNEENGFAVVVVEDEEDNSLNEIVIGTLSVLNPGEVVKFYGKWVNNPKFGRQFKCEYYEIVYPGTEEGLINFLSSGMIPGIGPAYAKRIVDKFGMETIKILSNTPDRLKEVEGIGEKRIKEIKESWNKHKAVRDIMVFLQSYGISLAYASRIYRTYRHKAVEKIRENPYCLAIDVSGIGFIMADKIAEKMGVKKDSINRAEAGILYLLKRYTEQGHTFYPLEWLSKDVQKELDVSSDSFSRAMERLVSKSWVVIENTTGGEKAVYLSSLYSAEITCAFELKRIKNFGKRYFKDVSYELIKEVELENGISFSKEQYEAVEKSLENSLLIITGGPGTGKTTLIKGIARIFNKYGAFVLLCAPTGRAAKRLSQATGMPAKTIHRLLEYNPRDNEFKKNKDNPLDADLIIVDETSMIDIVLLNKLLSAVKNGTSLIFVGDADQLPSVGPGNVLRDLIASGCIPYVRLKHIFRQKKGSDIVINAHKINRGQFIDISNKYSDNQRFYFIKMREPQKIKSAIEELVKNRIPSKFGYDKKEDIQVITPMYKGILGVDSLNESLQNICNPVESGLKKKNIIYKVGDKVMQVVNDYDKDVYNGDIGYIREIHEEAKYLIIEYNDKVVAYDFLDIDEIVLAYAISVHKSQGSEYKCVIMPISNQHYIMLQRNLLYTAITRGKELVVLVGDEEALRYAIKNDRITKRYTDLRGRIIKDFESFEIK